jgi:ABC-type lipoprotein release transport system permease subunit
MFMSGSLIAIDSSTRSTLAALLINVPGDFSVHMSTENFDDALADFLELPTVNRAVVYVDFELKEGLQSGGIASVDGTALAIDPENPPAAFQHAELEGTMSLARGMTVLSDDLANKLGVDLGDIIYVNGTKALGSSQCEAPFCTLSLVVEGIAHWRRGSPVPSLPWGPLLNVFVINLKDQEWFSDNIGRAEPPSVRVEIWTDRDALIDPYNLDSSRRNLVRLGRDLEEIARAYGQGGVQDNVSPILPSFVNLIRIQRIVFLYLALPLIALGAYLSAVSVDLSNESRGREIALLKMRGARQRTIYPSLFLEAIMGGLLATILAVVVGIPISRFLIGVVSVVESTPAEYGNILISLDTLSMLFALGMALMLASSFRSVRRTASLAPAETLRYRSERKPQSAYRPATDLALIAVGSAIFSSILLLRSMPDIYDFLLGPVGFVLIPLAPAFLLFGSTRIATRFSVRIFQWSSKPLKPFVGNLYGVLERNLLRNVRRSSNVTVIVALGIAFGVFALSMLESQINWQNRQIRASIGADMSVEYLPNFGAANFDIVGFERNISALAGVSAITRVYFLSVETSPERASVIAFEPTAYFAITQPESWYFLDADHALSQRLLMPRSNVLISDQYAQAAFLEVGDRIEVRGFVFNRSSGEMEERVVSATVAGIVRGLPGTLMDNANSQPIAVYGSLETFGSLLPDDEAFLEGFVSTVHQIRFLIDLAPDANWYRLSTVIEDLAAVRVRVLEEELKSAVHSPLILALTAFTRVEVVFAAAMMTVGVGLLLHSATQERRTEFAVFFARGAGARQVAVLLLGEGTALVLIGLTFGLGIGFGTSFLAAQVLLASPPGSPEPLVPFFFEASLEGLLFVILAPVSMVLAALLIAWRVAQINAAKVLKLRVT